MRRGGAEMTAGFESVQVGERIHGPGLGLALHPGDETLIRRMLTDWAYPLGAIHRRLETRWLKPIRPGDTIRPSGLIKAKQATEKSRYVLVDVVVRNQAGERIATGEAMVEF